LRVFAGKGARARAAGACAGGAILVLSEDWLAPASDCTVFDRRRLRRTGAVAAYPGAEGLRLVTARDWAGKRIWNRTDWLRRGR
ncbi:MAG: competence protein, partial [Rhodobacteraceae bacterium]|nr:competence protein [Paracoccaceae bacterium]